MARIACRRPSWLIRPRPGSVDRHRCRPPSVMIRGLVAGPIDPNVEPSRRQRVAHAFGPFHERHAGRLAVIDQPAPERVGGIGQAIQVDVEQRQPALVLGHEDERGRHDGIGHAEARAESLREVRLAGPELAPQADEIAGGGHAGQGRAQACRGRRVGADDGARRNGGGRHRCERSRKVSRTAPGPRAAPRSWRPRARGRAAASRWTPPLNRRGPSNPAQVPSRPACSPARTRT